MAIETLQLVGGRTPGHAPEAPAPLPAPPVPVAPPVTPGIYVAPPQPGIYPAPAVPGGPALPSPTGPIEEAVVSPLPPAPEAPAAPRRGLSTGCLVAIVIVLTLLALGVCVVAVLLFLPNSPVRQLLGIGAAPFPPVAATTAAPPPTSAPAAAPPPTAAPAALGPRAITLQNAAEITQTREITSPVVGPVSYSPDGKLLAIGASNGISLNSSDSLDEVRVLTGHTGAISALAWSPDSTILASGAIDENVLRLWDPATGKQLRMLEGHTGWIRSLAYSPDGKLLASGSTDMTVRLWDVATGRSLQTLRGHTDLLGGVAFSPDGKTLASASRDGSVRLWDVATGQPRAGFTFQTPFDQTLGARYWTTGVAFSPDGKTLAVGAIDGIVRLLDPSTGQVQRELKGHTSWIVIRGVVFSPDGKTLATASTDGTVRLWDPANGNEIATLDEHRFQILAISFSSDGKRLASSSDEEGLFFVWDIASKQTVEGRRVGQGLIASLAFSPDSKTIGAVGFNGSVRLFPLDAQASVRALAGSRLAAQQSLAFLPGDRVVAITESDRVSIFGDDQSPGQALAGLDGQPLSVSASRSGTLIAAGSSSGAIAIWDAATGNARPLLQTGLGAVVRLAFNDDGSLLAAAGVPDAQNKTPIEVWDTVAGSRRQTLVGSQGVVTALAFQPDGTLVAAADLQGALRLWNSQDGKVVETFMAQPEQQRFVGIAFSPDGAALAASALNGDIQFWNPTTGAESAKVSFGVGASTLAYSPDGQMIAVGGRDETVRVLELPTK